MRKRDRRVRRLPVHIKELRLEIEGWRRTRTKLSPMPAELWNGAVAMAGEYGPSAIARMLGLDYKALRARVADADAGAKTASAAAGFIEVRPASTFGVVRPAETVLELSDAGGMRLVLSRGCGGDVDVIRLVEVFRKSAR